MVSSRNQKLLEQGKYLIAQFEGWWYMILPATSWLVEFMGDNIFRTSFESDVAEATVREFYTQRLTVQPDEIVKAV